MSYSFVASSFTNRHPFNATTLTTPASLTVQAGDTIIVAALSQDAGPFTVSDGTSNTYTALAGVNNLKMFYCLSAAGGTYAITVSGGTHLYNVAAFQYRGLNNFQNATFTQQNSPGTGANIINSGNATCSPAPALVFGIGIEASQILIDPPTYTGIQAGTSPLAFNDQGGFWNNLSAFSTAWFEDIRVTAGGNYAATFGVNGAHGTDSFYSGVLIFGELVPLQSASGSSNGHTTVTAVFGSPVTAGSLLVAYVGSPNQGQTCSASDPINGAYNTDLAHPSGGLSICSFPNSQATAANLTVTGSITGAAVPLTMIIEEWPNVRGISPLDKTASQTNTAAVSGMTGTTAALSQPFELVLAAMEDNNTSGTGAGASFTVSSPFNPCANSPVAQGAGVYNLATGSFLATTTAAQSAQFTWANSSGSRGAIATYRTNVVSFNAQSLTSSEGTPGAAVSYTPSAYTVTSAEGTPTRALAVTGPAQTATFVEGSIVGAINLTAQTITSVEGTVSVSISGDVSLALGAIQTQFVEGVPIFVVSYTLDQNLFVLVGQSATFSEGALALEVDQFPTAQTITSTEGTIAAEQLGVTLGSLNITSAEGLIVANAGNNFNNNLTSQTIQSQLFLGVPPASVSYPITAQSGTLVEGTITFSNTTNFSVNLVGQLAVFTEGIIVRNVPQGTGPPLFIPPQLGKPVTTRTFSWSEMAQRAWGSEFRAPDHRIYQFSGGNYKDSTDLGTTGIYSPNLGTPDNP